MRHSVRTAVLGVLGGVLAGGMLAQEIGPAAQATINSVVAAKRNFSAAQKKVDSNLVFSAMAARNDASVNAFRDALPTMADAAGTVTVDISGNVTPGLLAGIGAVGGSVVYQSARWGSIRATLPLNTVEALAASGDVKSIRAAARAHTNGPRGFGKAPRGRSTPASILSRSGLDLIGALTSQGYISHSANLVVNNQGINGTGVKVGVISDSASAARIATLIASGDLPVGTTFLPGESGEPGTDEGTAMMEIVRDVAPGATLVFATAFKSPASFADNIIALQQAGCKIIVDDVSYFDEAVFQDGPIAQAVNQVTAAGSIYFSSAANSGNLTLGTSGTWEGDFLSNGAAAGVLAGAGTVHNFGTVGSPQGYNVLTSAATFVQVKWSDPLGASTNDYDLYILNSTGTTLKAVGAGTQDGTQDPYEIVYLNNGNTNFSANDRVVVVKFAGQDRALHLDTVGGHLSIKTSGAVYGHNGGLNTVSTAATYWNSAKTGTRAFTGAANPIEPFSSDGPRKIFYDVTGTAITPGNLLFATNGGTTLQKPDLTAADGVSTKTPGFNPFYGTSAAAPHAAGIAALILQAKPTYTPAQVKAAMVNTALDNMAAGIDRDSGYGITMATLAVQYALSH